MSSCIRCAQVSHQYGTDGLPYCDSCIFYGMNKQCQKCAMYLPNLELQMYMGQWYCPYCVMDLRDQNKPHHEKTQKRNTQTIKHEYCERCGKLLKTTVYILNGRKLCKTCLDSEKDDHGPTSPPVMSISLQRKNHPFYAPILSPATLFFEGLISWILIKLGLKKDIPKTNTDIVAVKPPEKKSKKKPTKIIPKKTKKTHSKVKKTSKKTKKKPPKEYKGKFDWVEMKKD